MCGGAIVADLIPGERGGRRVAASDLWPNPNNPSNHHNDLQNPQGNHPICLYFIASRNLSNICIACEVY